MADRLQEFRDIVEDGRKAWTSRVANPYVDAYAAAFYDFKKTLNDQAEADKRNAELSILAASVVTGSLLMATVGSASLKVLAGRAALRLVSAANLKRTYKALNALGHNEAAKFAIGAFLDEAKSTVKGEATKRVKSLIGFSPGRLTSSPLSLKIQIESMLIEQALCATDTATMIETSNTLTEAEKQAHFQILRRAPIATRPTDMLATGPLISRIELSMFMSYILDLDSLIDVPTQVTGGQFSGLGNALVNRETSRSIDIMPSSADYPRPAGPRLQGNIIPSHKRIGITQAGGEIVKRTNELHATVIGGRFFENTSFWSRSTSPHELRKAESTLNELGRRSRPASPYAAWVGSA